MLRTILGVALIGVLSACSAAVLRDVAVDWENRTEDVYTITFAAAHRRRC